MLRLGAVGRRTLPTLLHSPPRLVVLAMPTCRCPAARLCTPGLGLKAVWHGAEALGNVIGAQQQLTGSGTRSGGGSSSSGAAAAGSLTREQAIAAIKEDYARNYFVSGGVREAHSAAAQALETPGCLQGSRRGCQPAQPPAVAAPPSRHGRPGGLRPRLLLCRRLFVLLGHAALQEQREQPGLAAAGHPAGERWVWESGLRSRMLVCAVLRAIVRVWAPGHAGVLVSHAGHAALMRITDGLRLQGACMAWPGGAQPPHRPPAARRPAGRDWVERGRGRARHSLAVQRDPRPAVAAAPGGGGGHHTRV